MENKKMNIKQGVARIDTDTIIHSANNLGEVQKKALLYFISKIDHNKEFKKGIPVSVIIPFSDMVKGLGTYGINWKKGKLKFDQFTRELAQAQIEFLSEVVVNGKPLIGIKNWFSGISPVIKNGTPCYEVIFNSDIMNTITNLKKFTRLYSKDFAHITGKSTIDLFSVFVALNGKQSQFKDKIEVKFSVDELKRKLNIKINEYQDIRDFKKFIIDYAVKQINKSTSIYVWYEHIKTGRKITGFHFFIVKNYSNDRDSYLPSPNDLGTLTLYQYEAYKILKTYGVIPGIILKQFIPKLPKGAMEGYEDLFIKACINHFENNTNKKTLKEKTGAFVQWFCTNKIYTDDSSLEFVKIREQVLDKLKKLDPIQFDERVRNQKITIIDKYGEQGLLSL